MGVKKPSKKSSLARRQFWIKTVLQNGRYQALPLITGNGPDDLPMIDPDWQELPGIPHGDYLLRRCIGALLQRISSKRPEEAEWLRWKLWILAGMEKSFKDWDSQNESGLEPYFRDRLNEIIRSIACGEHPRKNKGHDREILLIQEIEMKQILRKYPGGSLEGRKIWLRDRWPVIAGRMYGAPCWCVARVQDIATAPDEDTFTDLSNYEDRNELCFALLRLFHKNKKGDLPTLESLMEYRKPSSPSMFS